MKIKRILTTEVHFEYDGELNKLNIQEFIENECPVFEDTTQRIIIEGE